MALGGIFAWASLGLHGPTFQCMVLEVVVDCEFDALWSIRELPHLVHSALFRDRGTFREAIQNRGTGPHMNDTLEKARSPDARKYEQQINVSYKKRRGTHRPCCGEGPGRGEIPWGGERVL